MYVIKRVDTEQYFAKMNGGNPYFSSLDYAHNFIKYKRAIQFKEILHDRLKMIGNAPNFEIKKISGYVLKCLNGGSGYYNNVNYHAKKEDAHIFTTKALAEAKRISIYETLNKPGLDIGIKFEIQKIN